VGLQLVNRELLMVTRVRQRGAKSRAEALGSVTSWPFTVQTDKQKSYLFSFWFVGFLCGAVFIIWILLC